MPKAGFEDEDNGRAACDWLLREDFRAVLTPFGGVEGGDEDMEGCDRGEAAREEGFGGDKRS